MNNFRKDRNYLLKYSLTSGIVFLFMNSAILILRSGHLNFHINTELAPIALLSILLCGLPSSILHNCAHGNWKPKFLNTVLGEIFGTVMLYGFKGFKLGHMFHHKFPDDPDYDVHPPKGYRFHQFLVSPIEDTLKVIERVYFEYYGDNESSRRNIFWQKIFFNFSIVMRLSFWLLLLGPSLFVFLYLPLYVLNIFVFAHINYAAHIINKEGNSEVVNLNHNIYYRIVNVLSMGGYFHKSHHLKPQCLNPAKAIIDDNTAYVTFIHEKKVVINKKLEKRHLRLVKAQYL
ncbi:MAG: hypothetical protein COW00_09265 [Bdellovibrio sp. CG12_big_fil_rev_8_21_14_0_65_39_13]|nr:MAG: hypothetical protein COW78_09335 [Bdellovibrio sp. CG22_combo_CG10-13_8_21_14_all_39_27]PIQ59810.1 MAG: hypothetical protein COW00_09265 [Bdellovibrio sp. CG12_big_fil_rev_8_21_14_0_65_39_13]PIR36162.1 MAG: hypothetical protein COV37_04125 [Bdellovibrio sp. CG11_big_fil_rev_8_21_14_0_20_39_38]